MIAILEARRVELRHLRVDDVGRELQHLRLDFDVPDVLEELLVVAHLIGIFERARHEALAARLQHDDALAAVEDDAAEAHDLLLRHRLANDCEGLLGDLAARREIIGRVDVDVVDLGAGHEALDVDGVCRLDRDLVDLVLFHDHVFALADLVAFDLVRGIDDLLGLRINQLAAQAIARLAVEEMEGDALLLGRRWVELDGAGDQRELQISLPVGTRRHRKTPHTLGQRGLRCDSTRVLRSRSRPHGEDSESIDVAGPKFTD